MKGNRIFLALTVAAAVTSAPSQAMPLVQNDTLALNMRAYIQALG